MAPRKPKITDDEIIDNTDDTETLRFQSLEDSPEYREIVEFIEGEVGKGITLTLKRQPPDEMDFFHVKSDVPLEHFSLDMLAKRYGGGKYKAVAKNSDGKIMKHFKFNIDPRYEGNLGIVSRKDDSVAMEMLRILKERDKPADNSMFITMMQENTRMQAEARKEADERRHQTMTLAVSLVGALTPVFVEVMKSKKDPFDSVLKAVEVFQPKGNNLDDLSKLLALTDRIRGDTKEPEEESIMGKLATVLATVAKPMMESLSQRKQPVALQAAPVTGNDEPADTFDPALFSDQLEMAYNSNSKPEDLCKMFTTQVPQEMQDVVREWLEEDGWEEDMGEGWEDPDKKVWLTKLRELLLAAWKNADETQS